MIAKNLPKSTPTPPLPPPKGLLASKHLRDAEVAYAEVAFLRQEQVLRLQVPMYDVPLVQILQTSKSRCCWGQWLVDCPWENPRQT